MNKVTGTLVLLVVGACVALIILFRQTGDWVSQALKAMNIQALPTIDSIAPAIQANLPALSLTSITGLAGGAGVLAKLYSVAKSKLASTQTQLAKQSIKSDSMISQIQTQAKQMMDQKVAETQQQMEAQYKPLLEEYKTQANSASMTVDQKTIENKNLQVQVTALQEILKQKYPEVIEKTIVK